MSLQTYTQVLEHSRSQGLARLVFLMMADGAGGGYDGHPSTIQMKSPDTVCRRSNCSIGEFFIAVGTLLDLGEITRVDDLTFTINLPSGS